jgi:hypothetical protein
MQFKEKKEFRKQENSAYENICHYCGRMPSFDVHTV